MLIDHLIIICYAFHLSQLQYQYIQKMKILLVW